MTLRSTLPEWQAVANQAQRLSSVHLSTLWANDPERASRWLTHVGPLLLDLGKQRLDADALSALLDLAEAVDVKGTLASQFAGDPVNLTEGRAAWHTALRAPVKRAEVAASLQRMSEIVTQIHQGHWRGSNGYPIRDVVNIGVGGSDLGPKMVCESLSEMACGKGAALGIHFVSSIDGAQLSDLLHTLRPETTLFIISSKSFTTSDTLANARTALDWLAKAVPDAASRLRHHVIGVSASPAKMTEFGIPEQNQLLFWDWVGGRFSLWSAIGLPIALRIGMSGFNELLAGAAWMDQHALNAPLIDNLPVLLGLVGVWNATFLQLRGHAVLPYDGRLASFPAFLTQLEMESNGKSVNRQGEPVDYLTCPVLWGEVGANAQHAFYQLLHQGTQPVSADFIAPVRRYLDAGESLQRQHRLNLANCLAQSQVLAFGDACLAEPNASPHRRYAGNQPSSTLLIDELNPYALGALIALYEHKVSVMAALWDINPFDQWGVELGKQVAGETEQMLLGAQPSANVDGSTLALIKHIRQEHTACKS
ncbi:MAG: glucose-6-phosphate isomerase [Moraxellaceae bacterium]|nr:glucose-6-phosphate isomerase [Moraxellaceae bacterium]